MSHGIDIDFVRETYQKMSDEDLIRILTTDAAGLTLEAQALVKDEIKRRNLNSDIGRGVDVQQKTLNEAEAEKRVIITHGSDTMLLTAAVLAGKVE